MNRRAQPFLKLTEMFSDTESPIEEVSIWAFFIKIDIKMI